MTDGLPHGAHSTPDALLRSEAPPPPSGRTRKFRQAAFFYLHVGILYEFAVVAMWQSGLVNPARGPVALWLLLGAAIVALVFWGLWFRESVWLARGVWGLHSFRLPSMIGGAFFPDPGATLPSSFYLTALMVIVLNLWLLARAGWDL